MYELDGPMTISGPRWYAQTIMPYFSRPITVMDSIEAPGLGSFAVDKYWRLYFDPELLQQWTLTELSTVILHEAFHLVFNHHARLRFIHSEPTSEEAGMWNIATDMAINSILHVTPKARLPKGCVYPWDFPGFNNEINFPRNLSAEEYYKLLRELPQHVQNKMFDASQENMFDNPLIPASGTDGIEREWELGADVDENGIDEIQERRIQRSTVQELKGARDSGKFPGLNSGEFSEVITRILEPKVDPAAEIFASVKYAVNSIHGYGEKTFSKRNPRQPKGSLVMPANRRPIPQVRVLIDTSASMSADTDLALAAGVVAKVLNALPGEGVEVYCADTQIQSVQKVFRADNITGKGRGGTRMEVAIPQVDQDDPRPDVVICITDGETGWPEKETQAKLIICLTRNWDQDSSLPTWAKIIHIAGN